MNRTVKKIAGGTFIAIASLLIGFFAHEVSASTVYETEAPLQTVVLTNTFGTGQSKNTTYMKVPLGTQFDRVALSLTNAGSFYYGVRNDPNGDSFPCTDVPMSNCYDDDTWVSGPSGPATGVLKNTGVYEYVVGTTTITTSSTYFFFEYNVNITQTTGMDVTNSNNGVSYSYSEYSGTDSYSTVMPAMLFCNGSCSNYQFNPVPNLTASPWARMVSPTNNSQQTSTVSFTIQTNTGTTTADSVEVRFLSNFQSIVPETYNLNVSGIQQYNFTRTFPAINDTIQIEVHMLSGSTTIVTSPTYSIRIGDTLTLPSQEETENCDGTSGIGWAICSTFVFLLVPSDNAINQFTDLYGTMSNKFPFAYFTDFNDSISSLYTSATTQSLAITVPFGEIGELDLISEAQIEAIPLSSTVRTIIGMLIWLLLGATIYRRTYRIFNNTTS